MGDRTGVPNRSGERHGLTRKSRPLAVNAKVRDSMGVVWTIVEITHEGKTLTLRAGPVTRLVTRERIADWAMVP